MNKLTTALTSLLFLGMTTGHAAEANDIKEAEQPDNASIAETGRTNKFKPIVLPFYDPSIKAGVMAVPLYAFYPDDQDTVSDASTIAAPIIITSNGSYIAKLTADIILMEDRVRFTAEGGRTSTNMSLLGSVDTNKEEWSFEGDAYYKLFDDFFLSAGINWMRSRYTADNASEQNLLEQAGFFDEYNDDLGMRVGFKWDTRDQYYYPYSGFVWDTRYETHADWLGNDEDSAYSSLFTDYRYFYSINGDANRIIASKLTGRYLIDAEKAPSSAFTTYGRQGKEVQRGFVMGEYINSNMINLETEYRHRLSNTGNDYLNKSSLIGIAGVGKSFGVDPQTREDVSFGDNDWLGVIGLGYRYNILPYERINIKVDVTLNSDGDVIAYFGVGESI